MRNRWGALLLTFLSLTVSLLLAETASRFVFRRPMSGPIFTYDPILGHRNKPNVHTSQLYDDHRTEIITNSQGLRIDREVAAEPSDNEIRVLTLGDSFLFGMGVAREESFVTLLESRAKNELSPKFEFINFGVGDYGTQHAVGALELRGFQYHPKLIVHFMGPDDVDQDNEQRIYDFTSEKARLRTGGAPPITDLKLQRLASQIPGYDFLASHSQLFGLLRFAVASGRYKAMQRNEPRLPASAATDENTKRMLLHLKELAEEHGVPLVVVPVGRLVSYGSTSEFLKQAERWCREHKIDYVDVSAGLDPAKEKLTFETDGHYSPLGHRRYAEALWPQLKARLTKIVVY